MAFCTPLSRADRTMPRTDRWSPGNSRGHHGPLRGTRDHTRRSEGHSDGHHRPRGRSAGDEQGRELRGRSRERSTLTRVRPSRRPTPSEMRDRSMRREHSRSRERSTLSRLSSRTITHSLQHREAGHTPGYSTEPEQRSLAHSQSQTTLNASEILRNVRARVVQTHSLPMYLGPSTQGKRTVANSAVLFQNHVSKILATTDDGVFALPQDSPGNPVWRTRADDLTSKRRELLTDLLADYFPTYCLMTESQPVVVYRISGQCQPTQVRHVTATDWLRLLVREEGLNSEAKHAALETLDSITTKPDESWLSATAHQVSAFRATRIDLNRPHVTEATFFWRYVSEHDLKELMERLAYLLVPSELERFGVDAITNIFIKEASDTLRTNPVEPQCPMGYNMRMRGTETRELFDRYANMLSARRPRNNKRKFSSRTHIAAIGNHSAPHKTPSDHAAENEELRQLLRDAKESIYRLTGRDSLTPTDTTPKSSGVAPPRYAAAYQAASHSVAAIQNQTATVSGQHGVPFLTRRFDDQRNKRNNRDEAHLPSAAPSRPCPAPTATRREITSFIRVNRICFRHAFGIPSVSSAKCPYNHNLILEGYYKHLPRANKSVRNHESTPRPAGHTDTLALSAESVNALAYLAGLQCDDDDESVGTPDTDTAHDEQPFIESYPYTSGSDVWPPTAPDTN